MDSWKLIAFGLTHLLGWGVISIAIVQLRALERARTWPRVPGTITRSTTRRDDGYVKPEIEFRYTVEGSDHTGNVPVLGGFIAPSWTSSPAERLVAKYPEVSAALVSYDPADPRRSCLDVGAPTAARLIAFVGFVFALVGAYGVWAGWSGL